MFSIGGGRHPTGSARFSLALVLALICAASLYAWLNRPASEPPPPAGSLPSIQKPMHGANDDGRNGQGAPRIQPEPSAEAQTSEASDDDVENIKAQQAKAARAAIEAEPLNGTLSGRPEFVSELEWEVLLQATGDNPEMDEQLTHLVNKLLFFKKRKAWMAPAMDSARRKKLARDLLAMLPKQVTQRAITSDFADKMEHDLQHYLEESATEGDR
jgi:hypothetical protein